MKNKLGFTLIELLAVIVILAIIALIASPIIVGLIEDSKRSATERSADSYTSGIEIAVANKKLNRESIPDVAYTVMANGNLCSGEVTGETCTGTMLDIKMDGEKPTSGIVNLDENGKVATATLCINDAKVSYTDGIAKHKSTSCTNMTYTENVLNGTDPVLGTNMIPVRIDDNGTVTYADLNDGWYDYSNQEWANAVMLSSGTYSVGDTIPESAIESYFVWIPRYKYKIFDTGNYSNALSEVPTSSNAQTIEIVFEDKDTVVSNGSTVDSWLTHPAFTSFDVNGIWVGKFETGYLGATTTAEAQVTSTDSSKIIVKPDVYSWRNNTVYNMFVAAYNYDTTNKSHMMKNTEWGAVAYLSHSKYGINKEININNNSAYKTGYSAVEGTDQSTYPGTFGTDTTKTLGYATRTGKNLFNINGVTWGQYDVFSSNSGNFSNAFKIIIPAVAGTSYSIKAVNSIFPFRFGYKFIDTNGNALAGIYNSISSTATKQWQNVIAPQNTVNIVLCQLDVSHQDASSFQIQLEIGTTSTSYEQYKILPSPEYSTTTGNITGVYDMSGGANEYMASYKSGQLGSSGFNTTNIAIYNSKYFDVYSTSSTISSYNYRILGDATGELGSFYNYLDGDGSSRFHNSWYSDISSFIDSSNSWFLRGGSYNSGVIAGQFSFSRSAGAVSTNLGSRLVLAVN